MDRKSPRPHPSSWPRVEMPSSSALWRALRGRAETSRAKRSLPSRNEWKRRCVARDGRPGVQHTPCEDCQPRDVKPTADDLRAEGGGGRCSRELRMTRDTRTPTPCITGARSSAGRPAIPRRPSPDGRAVAGQAFVAEHRRVRSWRRRLSRVIQKLRACPRVPLTEVLG